MIGEQGPQWLDGPAMQELEKKILGRGNFPSKDLASHSPAMYTYTHVLLIVHIAVEYKDSVDENQSLPTRRFFKKKLILATI